MDFESIRGTLTAKGYSEATADAKIAHDVILKAIRDSGFHDRLAIKGGVVMSGLTAVARRATMDMDVDFLHYPLANDAIRRFISGLSRVADCRIAIRGKIVPLNQQEYKGKRVFLSLTDERCHVIETKIDVGVHVREEVRQGEFVFRLAMDGSTVTLLANSCEQIFVEKLKSLLKFGSASTRFKDVYDLCYLLSHVHKDVLASYLGMYVFGDPKMRESNVVDVSRRLTRIFADGDYMKALANPTSAWLDVSAEDAAARLVRFFDDLM